jgi:hypothetical protein
MSRTGRLGHRNPSCAPHQVDCRRGESFWKVPEARNSKTRPHINAKVPIDLQVDYGQKSPRLLIIACNSRFLRSLPGRATVSIMYPLTILSDSDVKRLLHSLTKGEVVELQEALRRSLSDYSTAKQSEDAGTLNQPERTVIESDKANGKTTTLFMPSTSAAGLGMKGMGLACGPLDLH